ncbi:hypothetical protein [Pseudomonas simiae]
MSSQWKLVPVEPTEAMVIHGFESAPNECFTDYKVWDAYQEMSGCQQAAFRAKLCWAAMIAAAPAPGTHTAVPEESAGMDFGIDGRSVRVSQEAYSIFLAREAAGREKIAAMQQRLTAADERADAGIAFVIRLIQCSEGQPSIATGYLRDILDVLKQTEGILTPTTCTWKFGAFSWHTACGQEWMLNDGTPEQNGMRFCHSCGNALVAEEPEDA